MTLYKYYLLARPFGPGTAPNGFWLATWHNFPEREYVEEIGRRAWGVAFYNRPLPAEMVENYELSKGIEVEVDA